MILQGGWITEPHIIQIQSQNQVQPTPWPFTSLGSLVCLKPGGPCWARRPKLLKWLAPNLPTLQAHMSLHRLGLCGGDGRTGWGIGHGQTAANISATICGVCVVDQTLWGPQRLEGKDATLPKRGTQVAVGEERNSVRKENSVRGGGFHKVRHSMRGRGFHYRRGL